MFGKSESRPKSGVFESLIGKSMEFTGTIRSKGSLKIEGSVQGDVQCQGDVAIGASAIIDADVHAHDATIAGSVKGNVECKGRLELISGARVSGDVSASMLVVSEGAYLNGAAKVADTKARGEDLAQTASGAENGD